MRLPASLTSRAWIFVLLGATVLLLGCDFARIARVRYVSSIGAETTTLDSTSPTGWAGGKRWLVVPEHSTPSYQWIAETQQMAAAGVWRVRRVDYENAPFGREVHTAAPYHAWLRVLAFVDQALFQTSPGLAVERTALWSETAVHLLALVGSTLFVAWRFGNRSAMAVAFSWIALFPLAAAFLPGVPQDLSFAQVCALGSVLPLLAALVDRPALRARAAKTAESGTTAAALKRSGWFAVAGIFGGLGLWNSAGKEVPVLLGIALGGAVCVLLNRQKAGTKNSVSTLSLPWRSWALGGALTSLLAYLIEYAPSHLDFRLQVNHPLYALSWLGAGELLSQLRVWLDRPASRWTWRNTAAVILGLCLLAALPLGIVLTKTQGLLHQDPLGARLTSLPEGTVAKDLGAWLKQEGLNLNFVAALLPLLLLGPITALALRRGTPATLRSGLFLALGPVLAGALLAFGQLRWWSMTDALLIALVALSAVALEGEPQRRLRKLWWPAFLGVLFAGLAASTCDLVTRKKDVFTRLEVESLVERDLANWMADRVAGLPAVILAPPERTPTLCYFGGLRGVGTPNWENQEGVSGTVRIMSATTVDEAQALLNQRSVTHILLPSWDSDLDHFVEWNMSNPKDSFLHALHQWALPPWLRALPYTVPAIAGFENQSVVVLELTEENERAPSLARLAEYFLETEQIALARAAAQSLAIYPADLGALVARASVEKTAGDTEAYAKTVKALLANLSGGNDRVLPWDRRVSLAIVLAQTERTDLARKQVERCLREIDAERIHSLTTVPLFRLQVLAKAFDLKISDPNLRELALKPLSPELRSRL